MYLVSACLAGVNCRYDGENSENSFVSKLVKEGRAVPVCPEVLGGLSIPRVSCEIIIDEFGDKRVISKDGQDLTNNFIDGAEKTLKIAKIIGIRKAILKLRSPSCGYGFIYNGDFSGEFKRGNGFTTDLLIKNGITIYTENDIAELDL